MKKINKLLTLKSELVKLLEDSKFLSPQMSVEDLLSYIKSSVSSSLELLKCVTTGGFRHQIYQTANGFLVEGETLNEFSTLEEAIKENGFFRKVNFYIYNEFLIVDERGEEIYAAPSWLIDEIREGKCNFIFKNCNDIAYLHKFGNWRIGTIERFYPRNFETQKTIWRDGYSVSLQEVEKAVKKNNKHQELKLTGEKVSEKDIEWDDEREIIQPDGFEIQWLNDLETREEITLRLCKRDRGVEGAYYKVPK